MLAIRITKTNTFTRENLLDHFENRFSKYLITEENVSTNHHYNICLQTDKTATAVRNGFVRALTLSSKNNEYYCKVKDLNYHIYIVKEGRKSIIHNTLYTEEEIDIMIQQSYNKNPTGKNTFKTAMLNYKPIDGSNQQRNRHIRDYVMAWVKGELHDERTIQRLGNAIASMHYFVEYSAQEYFFLPL